ncbi:hypothetical protein CB0940_04240 [Cercospora beticola]|uniref:Uncharacterized protein n=1 Tax=Cercospora beticola TaxID=122368 RepID=A0A2G5HJM0_CERBT|nr:hypothetical protein CB0940_04240 [Cercospora beticola]PIA92720.1 hypothetical protein CB0940_04240 [Cercospora beticola]WPB01463.1 hypothetical protein RHO25_006089 [Cercospora beticola]
MDGKAHQSTTQSSPVEYMAVQQPPLDSSSSTTAHRFLDLENGLMHRSQPTNIEPAAQQALLNPSSRNEIFDFFALPRELRDQIYDFTLDEPKHIKTSSLQIGQPWDAAYLAHAPVLGLLLANKQMNQEYQDAIKRAEPSQKLTLVIDPDVRYYLPAETLVPCDEYLTSKLRMVPKLEVIFSWFYEYTDRYDNGVTADSSWSDDDIADNLRRIGKDLRTVLVRPLLHQQALTNIALIVRGAIEDDIEEEVDFPMLTSALRDCGKNICSAEKSDDSYPMLLQGIKLTYCIDMEMQVRKVTAIPRVRRKSGLANQQFWKKGRSYYWRTYRATPSTCEDNFYGFDLEKLEPEEAEFMEKHTR